MSITEILSNPLITVVIALASAIVPIILYFREKTNSREMILQSHLVKIYDMISKIIEEKEAANLLSAYQDLKKENATYDENSDNPANNAFKMFGPVLCAYLSFLWCQNSALNLTIKSKEFHLEYQSMDSKGYLSLLRKRHKDTYSQLSQFDNYISGILLILGQNANIESINFDSSLDNYVQTKPPEHLRLLLQITPHLNELLSRAPIIEKQLSNFI